ncbi:transcriptional regulator, TetR family [Desulforamulus reducens MI-1]|uniref:Transcriptional regulator, TetR family n=1 Tax=Desulforamulus reducens (strain ATCC BAA-1160 / DSM 100696 / MI-1) TaxID=349161 RepID=A4J879_DESRM|nr:TetR/AcrR family transcriptional regulator [Desulforamulus reducens]ABO51282.1 transcriptional regulator, TetR family [Desulforamulus reducens MI-1]
MAYRQTNKVMEKLQSKKKEILTAAREVFAENSYQRTSIKAIAQKAKIATGTFYLYFRNKDALINMIVEEMFYELLESIRNERANFSDGFDKLQASMETCIKLFIKEKNMAKILLVQVPGVNNAFNAKLIDIENELIKLTKEDLDELKSQGRIPNEDTFVSALAFVGSFRQVIINWLREGKPEDLEVSVATLMKYNLRGMGKRDVS